MALTVTTYSVITRQRVSFQIDFRPEPVVSTGVIMTTASYPGSDSFFFSIDWKPNEGVAAVLRGAGKKVPAKLTGGSARDENGVGIVHYEKLKLKVRVADKPDLLELWQWVRDAELAIREAQAAHTQREKDSLPAGTRVWAFEWQTSACDFQILEAIIPDPSDPSLQQYSEWYRRCAIFGIENGQHIRLPQIRWQDLETLFPGRKSSHAFLGCDNAAWIITDSERATILALNQTRAAAEKAKEDAEQQAADAAHAAIVAAAVSTGKDQVLSSWMGDCDGSATDCSFDHLERRVRPDGTQYTSRIHCH